MPNGTCKKLNCRQTQFRSTAFYYNLFLPPVVKAGISKPWYDHGIQSFDRRYEGDTLVFRTTTAEILSPL